METIRGADDTAFRPAMTLMIGATGQGLAACTRRSHVQASTATMTALVHCPPAVCLLRK